MVWYHMSAELADRPRNNRARAFPLLSLSLPLPLSMARVLGVLGEQPMIDEWSDEWEVRSDGWWVMSDEW